MLDFMSECALHLDQKQQKKQYFAKSACVHNTQNYKQTPFNSLEFQKNSFLD